MFCPKCGNKVEIENTHCSLNRPKEWWDALELDINTEIKFDEKLEEVEEIEDEWNGYCENPWND